MIYLNKLKFPTIFTTAALSLSIWGISSNFAHANEGNSIPRVTHEKQGHLDITTYYYDEPVNYDFQTYMLPNYTPYYIPDDFKEYALSTQTLYKQKAWGSEIRNDSPLADSVTRSVARTKFANGKIGASAETAVNWKLIQGKVGINGEAAWGSSTTITVSYNIQLPAKHKTYVEIGTRAVKSTGSIVEYRSGVEVKRTAVNVDYSYDEYMDKKSTPL